METLWKHPFTVSVFVVRRRSRARNPLADTRPASFLNRSMLTAIKTQELQAGRAGPDCRPHAAQVAAAMGDEVLFNCFLAVLITSTRP